MTDDFFNRRIRSETASNPTTFARAAKTLLDGSLRIRHGGDGLYPAPPRSVTKPAEAIAAWINSMAQDAETGPFHRNNEMREALAAAGDEVNAAVKDAGETSSLVSLRNALYRDALDLIDSDKKAWYHHPVVPWVAAGTLGGVVIGLLIAIFRRRP